MEIFEKKCKIYTLNGILNAKATASCTDGKTYIQSNDASLNIVVYTQLAISKFNDDKVPLFYNCKLILDL